MSLLSLGVLSHFLAFTKGSQYPMSCPVERPMWQGSHVEDLRFSVKPVSCVSLETAPPSHALRPLQLWLTSSLQSVRDLEADHLLSTTPNSQKSCDNKWWLF